MIPECSNCDIIVDYTEWRYESTRTVEDCKQLCMSRTDCVGIDFGHNSRKGDCYLNYGNILRTESNNDFNAWKKNPACSMIYMSIISIIPYIIFKLAGI